MEIPLYPAMRHLALKDNRSLDRLISRLQPRISEMTFAGLCHFRGGHDCRLARKGEPLVVMARLSCCPVEPTVKRRARQPAVGA